MTQYVFVSSVSVYAAGIGDRGLIVRAGLIVGPHDPTDRFAYWPRRIARGGQVLAPGDPADLVQVIDVRDLAGWIADGYHRGLGGGFNVIGKPMPFGHLLARCIAVTSSDADLVWIPADRLLAAGVDPWMGIPLRIGVPGWEGANNVDVARALGAGLRVRPLDDTIGDTLSWDLA